MSQAARLTALAQAVAADVKALQAAGSGSTAYAVPSYAGARTKPFNPVNSTYNVTPTSMSRVRDKLADAETARVGISLWGHSIMAGAFSTVGRTDLATQIRRILAGEGAPISGDGFVMPYQNITGKDVKWTASGFADAADARWPWAYSSVANSIETYKSDRPGTVVDVPFLTGMGYGPVEVSIDGVVMETYDPQLGTAGAIVTRTYSGLSNTVHTVSLRSTTADPQGTVILGVQVRQPTGIEVSDRGMGGSTTANWIPTGAAGENYNIVANTGANDIVVLSVSGNDLIQNMSIATAKTNIQAILDALVAAGRAVILVVEPPGQTYEAGNTAYPGYSSARIAQNQSMLYDLADQYNIPLFDMYHALVSYSNMTTYGWSGDVFHPNASAYSIMGRLMAEAFFTTQPYDLAPDVNVAQNARDLPAYADPYLLKNNYNPALSAFNVKASNLRKFRAAAAKAALGLGSLEIIYIGDSIGAGATSLTVWDRPHSPPMSMRNEFARRGIPIGGTGLVRITDNGSGGWDPRWTFSGTGWNVNGRWFGFTATQNDQVVFTSDLPGDRVKIMYYDHGDNATWSVSVDGAASGSGFQAITNNNALSVRSVTLTTPVKAGSTITLKKTSTGVNYMDIIGIQVYNATRPGVNVHNLSMSGSLASGGPTPQWSWTDMATNALGNFLLYPTQITSDGGQPDLVIIGLGGNDKQNAQGPKTDAEVLAAFDTIKSRFPGADFVFVAELELSPTYTTQATWLTWLRSLYSYCDTNDHPLFDMRDRLGDYATMVANGLSTDNVGHVLGEVSEMIGRSWATALGIEFGNAETPKVRVVPTGTTGFASEPDGTVWIEYTP